MAVNNISSAYPQFRLSGLATGLDTDSMIKQLMQVERIPLDKLSQQKQLAEWKSDSYREITTLLSGFQSSFFDVLNPSSNMKSSCIYEKYTSDYSVEGVVTATGSSDALVLEHTITVDNLASAANAKSTDTISKALSGNVVTNFEINDYNNTFNLTLNGETKTITLTNGTYADANAVLGDLQSKVQSAFSSLNVSVNSGSLVFTSSNASDVISLTPNLSADNLMSALGLKSSGVGSTLSFPLSIAGTRGISLSIVEGNTTTTREIEWAATTTYNDSTALAADIQNKLDTAFGAGKLIASGADGKITITMGAGVNSLTISNSYKNDKVLETLGFSSGDSNKISLYDTLEKVSSKLRFGELNFNGDNLTLTINGTSITTKKTDTLSSLINKINSSSAGVTMTYSSFSDTFSLISNKVGEGTIALNDNGSNFFANTKQNVVNAGENASFTLDGKAATRATNTFTIDGVTYTINKEGTTDITLTQDVDTTFNSIKAFVDKYNEIVSKINSKLSEEYDRDYQPLTDDQKDAMSEDEITKWETKAKTGLLRNDSILEGIANNMRRAMSDMITGISGNLSSIGISTGSYMDKGKLFIDENKLKDAIKNDPEKVKNMFSKESSISYSPNLSSGARATRYAENGIANRIYDILQDNIRTIRDSDGNKGILLEKAGMVGDTSEVNNILYDEISDYDEKMTELSKKLADKEDSYYKKFSAMEEAIQKMNQQSSWLTSQFGGTSQS